MLVEDEVVPLQGRSGRGLGRERDAALPEADDRLLAGTVGIRLEVHGLLAFGRAAKPKWIRSAIDHEGPRLAHEPAAPRVMERAEEGHAAGSARLVPAYVDLRGAQIRTRYEVP